MDDTRTLSREQWLLDAVAIFRPWFAEVEKPLPPMVRVSVGWPKGKRKTTIGICHSSSSAEDGVSQMFISPAIVEPVQVLSTLLHELVHAADDCLNGHKAEFARVARGLGLTGKMTATVPGDELVTRLQDVAGKLGPFPHAKLTHSKAPQKTRMLKLHSPDCCGYIVRTTQKQLDNHGLPFCPHMEEMELG